MMARSAVVGLVAVIAVALGGLAWTFASGNSPQLGLDLQGGAQVVLHPRESVPNSVLDQAIEIIRNRVDALGVAEPEVSRQGSSIIVQLPGVKNTDRALEIVGQTAQLYFRPVQEVLPAQPTESPTTTAPVEGGIDINSTTPPEQDDPAKTVILPEKDKNGNVTSRLQLGPAEVTGQALSDASAVVNTSNGTWEVKFNLTSDGTDKWNAMAQKVGLNNRIAIDLDGEVKSAPSLSTTNFPGSGQISGNFSEGEAKDLGLVLRYGSLPVQLDRQQAQTVSASLGKDSLHAGLVSGAVGLLLVVLYMLLYYRALGLVVLFGLLLSGAIMYTLVTLLGQTSGLALTLAGCTGLIVSVGVTVDSYVVYFERLKDEIRSGKTIRSSVDRGFTRAYRTILAADAASFIGAMVLYVLSVGSVRGFALFLALSTLLDVVVAYLYTRPMVAMLGRSRFFTEARWFGVARGLDVRKAPAAAAAGGTG